MNTNIDSNETVGAVSGVELLRVLDANFNRAAEGLRVAEDVLRLVRNNAMLALQAKRMRHRLSDISIDLNAPEMVLSRNVAGDVGRTLQTEQEYSRTSAEDLLQANFKRVQQSLRVIEECLKTSRRPLALAAEALRYEAYQLEQASGTADFAQQELAGAQLYVLLDARPNRTAFMELAEELIDAGVDVIQLRAKNFDDRELIERGRILRRLTENRSTRWIMNDRADLAAIAGAAGVHLGQDDLTIAQARRFVSPRQWIGVSTHCLAQAEQAVWDGATYLGVGPTFVSNTKKFERFAGLELISQIAEKLAIPFFAIGGISIENVGQVLQAGATRIAVGHAIVDAASPRSAVTAFREKMAEIAQTK